MSEIRTDVTKLSVNLVGRSVAALDAAAEMCGDTKTDTVNRAIQIYAVIVKHHNEGKGSVRMTLVDMPGGRCRIEVNRPWWRLW